MVRALILLLLTASAVNTSAVLVYGRSEVSSMPSYPLYLYSFFNLSASRTYRANCAGWFHQDESYCLWCYNYECLGKRQCARVLCIGFVHVNNQFQHGQFRDIILGMFIILTVHRTAAEPKLTF